MFNNFFMGPFSLRRTMEWFKGGQNVYFEMENEGKSLTLNKSEKKKRFFTGTMKPMSAHDQKTLDTAVAMANEITTKSMNDLAVEKLPNSPSDRSKFHFKFPHVSLHHGSHPENDKEATGKQERRNFTEEANRVSSIQATITEESKLAYISLIEEPTPSSSLISHITKDANGHQPAEAPPIPNVRSLPKPMRFRQRPSSSEADITDNYDEFALPPRATKPKLINKPRHVRKHPLKLPAQLPADVNKPIIYQNAITGPVIVKNEVVEVHKVERKGVDVFDGPSTSKGVTNPFKSSSRGGSANPFVCYYTKETDSDESDGATEGGREPGNLVKDCVDHVSVEDLLEFADHKPCGRQRGVESDEVRIMSKVLKEQVTSEECLEALELSDWNVHHAIKLIRIKISVGNVALKDCCAELAKTCGDVGNTSDVLVSFHRNKVE